MRKLFVSIHILLGAVLRLAIPSKFEAGWEINKGKKKTGWKLQQTSKEYSFNPTMCVSYLDSAGEFVQNIGEVWVY